MIYVQILDMAHSDNAFSFKYGYNVNFSNFIPLLFFWDVFTSSTNLVIASNLIFLRFPASKMLCISPNTILTIVR